MAQDTCAVEGCDRPARKVGWCEPHYQRWRKHGDVGPGAIALREPGRICSIETCDRLVVSRGWCGKHYTRWVVHGDPLATNLPSRDLSTWERWNLYVERTDGGCWLWTGARASGTGYAHFGLAGGRTLSAHRFSYEHHIGPIPDGLVIDHLCRVRHCVNPDHLEAVTQAENVRRALGQITHCVHGHEYTPENTYVAKNGRRTCKECKRRAFREWRARNPR